jgi:hypothetical protein
VGNIIGVSYSAGPEIYQKRLQLLPRSARIAGLAGRDTAQITRQETQKAASSLGVKLIVVEVRGAEYERAFAAMVADRADALAVMGGLMAYGASSRALYRRVASFVDRIFKGRDPGGAAGRAADSVRADHQPQDGQGPRPHDPTVAPAAGG